MKAISETPEGRARVEAYEERRTQALAERVEWNIRNREPAAPEVARGFLDSVPQLRNEGDERGLGPQRDLRADGHAVHKRPAQVVRPRADPPAEREGVEPTPTFEAPRDAIIEADDEMSKNDGFSMEFVGTTELCGDLGNFEPEIDDDVSQRLLAWMGSSGPQLRRRQRRQRHTPLRLRRL